MRNNDYFTRCNEIYQMLIKSHIDDAILKAAENYNAAISRGKIKLNKESHLILSHILELAKSDLVLNLCKIYYDGREEGYKLLKLKNVLTNKGHKKDVELNVSEKYPLLREQIRAMRDKYLAHSELNRQVTPLNMADVLGALEVITDIYNKLCDTDIDERVQQVTNIGTIRFKVRKGLDTIILGNTIVQKDEQESGEKNA